MYASGSDIDAQAWSLDLPDIDIVHKLDMADNRKSDY